MTQYYIRTDGSNSNNGLSNTAGGAWLTLQKAANTVVAGDTVNVADGTYAGSISETTSGTSGAHIVYQSINKHGAVITPSGVGTNTLWNVTGGWVDLIGFEIDGTGGTSIRNGISMTGGNSTAQDLHIHHVAQNSGCDSQGGSGIRCDQSGGGTTNNNYNFVRCHVHHCGGTCDFIQGIYHQSNGLIQSNLVHDCTGGIHCGHDDHDIIVSNNTVFNCSNNAYYFGGCQEAYNNGCPTSGMLFYNNILYDNPGPHAVSGPTTAEDVGNVLKYNCYNGNTANFDIASPSNSSRSNEVTSNPLFVNYVSDGTGDYHLQSGSPCKGAGLNTYAPALDHDGNAMNNPPDLGAFAFGSTPAAGVNSYQARVRRLNHSSY
jgi:hypothetical protein